jgi:hypothetical protein
MTTKAEWTKRVEAWRASGKTLREFCEGREYNAKSLQWWGWRLRGEREQQDRKVRFARVVRKGGGPQVSQAGIVVYVGKARIELGARADRAALTMVLEALLAAGGGS